MKLLKLIKNECGGAFIWALILLMVGSLTLPPLMSLASNAIEASQMYERKTFQAYAADTGIKDSLWEIRYGDLDSLLADPADPSADYHPYDYFSDPWSYNLSDQPHADTVNGYDPEIFLKNVWIPKDIPGVDLLTPEEFESIIEDGKLIVTGDIPDTSTYRIRVQYYPDDLDGELIVDSLGVWLPAGFVYAGSNSLEEACDADDSLVYCDDATPALPEPHNGGTAIVWDFSSTITAFTDFIPEDEQGNIPLEASISFEFTSQQEGINPSAIAWIETSGVDAIPFSWDADTKIYEITSVAGDASVTAHVAKNELRDLGSQINGDYRAIGNSLMIDSNNSCYHCRDELLYDDGSDATVNDIASDAEVALAYLYWSGWVEEASSENVFNDECTNFTQSGIDGDWTNGANWSVDWHDGSLGFEGQRHSDAVCTTVVDDDCQNFDDDVYDPDDVAWVHNANWDIRYSQFRGQDNGGGGGGSTETITLLDDGFEAWGGSWDDNWDNNETTDWFQDNNPRHSGSFSAGSDRRNRNNLTSDNLDTSDADSINIDFWYRLDDTEDNDLVLYYYNGSSYVQISQIGGAREDRWHHYQDTITDSQYFKPNFRIRFDSNVSTSSWRGENVWVDDVVITKDVTTAGGTNDYLTMASGEDLSGYSGDITVSWDQDEGGRLESSDCLEVYFMNNSGEWVDVTGSSTNIGFCNDNPGDAEYVIGDHAGDDQFRHDNFRVQFRLSDSGWGGGEYCYIDNFVIEACNEPSNNESDRRLTLESNIDLSGYSAGDVTVSWDQDESGDCEGSGTYEDTLQYAFYNPVAGSWDDWNEAFSGDNPSSSYSVTLNNDDYYSEPGIRIRFRLGGDSGWVGDDEYCHIDNIRASVLGEIADTTAVFEINGTRVYFDDLGAPQQDIFGTEEIIADPAGGQQHNLNDRIQELPNLYYGPGTDPEGFSYSCRKDVTELIREFSNTGDGENHTGNGTYAVGEVDADTGEEWSYAGWSLIIIYESFSTDGHQLYLYDDLVSSERGGNLDFDDDGNPGGYISGFMIPDQIEDEANAARLTCFVVEGDEHYPDDSLRVNNYSLSNGASPMNNVWNSASPGMSEEGVDIDTFNIRWDWNLLMPGDTSAQIDMNTEIDYWNLTYIILSIRSETTTGNTLDYLLEF